MHRILSCKSSTSQWLRNTASAKVRHHIAAWVALGGVWYQSSARHPLQHVYAIEDAVSEIERERERESQREREREPERERERERAKEGERAREGGREGRRREGG